MPAADTIDALPEGLVHRMLAAQQEPRGVYDLHRQWAGAKFRSPRQTWVCHLVFQGSCELLLADTTLRIPAGHAYLLPAGSAHRQRWRPDGRDYRSTMVEFHCRAIDPGRGDPLLTVDRRAAAPIAGPDDCAAALARLHELLAHPRRTSFARRLRARGIWEGLLLDHLTSAFAAGIYALAEPTPAWLRELLVGLRPEIVRAACDVSRMAAVAGCSPSYLNRVFRRHLGTTPAAWLRDARLELAMRLLSSEPDQPIASLARHSGFASLSAFSRAFRRRYGLSPQACRRQVRRPGGDDR